MKFIAHRVNTIKELADVPVEYGVELDLRDFGSRLILGHEPFLDGEEFSDYLKWYKHGTMVLNIKSERIEYKVLELLKKYRITDYFFLDSSFPMIYQLSKDGESNIALRFSEFEAIETILKLQGKIKWVWVDCFTHLPINRNNYAVLKAAGFKLCLVSPELQGKNEKIEKYKSYLRREHITFDAICTKLYNIEKWK